jgi:hypothetical protein
LVTEPVLKTVEVLKPLGVRLSFPPLLINTRKVFLTNGYSNKRAN